MKRFTLFGAAAGLILLLAFAVSRTRAPRPRPVVRVRTPDGVVVEYPVQPGRANFDATLAGFLRNAMVFEEAYYAEMGVYTSDFAKLRITRPANTQLYIVRIGQDGMRMSAINSLSQMQCDVFSGDSARWAFGYAYDPRKPSCGKMR